ncbi:transcription termination factor MTEF18, mitochondrial-like [Lolium perenne]|uniref:transcription termination factor MTEF18, mitochondrial-like n=1 Tax=Lolium perenne TaxID=4522 RepID=UPI0021EA2AC7|nr:uncharacterized protein LOC127308993 [Lolium perenne]
MLRRRTILTRLLSSPTTSPIASLHRLLSAASPNPSFAVEDYLVGTCGLTRAQALKASAKLSHLKSPTNPDAVLAFLGGLGLSRADIAAVVAKDPKFLCASVDRTLASTVTDLTGTGLSHTEIARLVSLAPFSFRSRSIGSNLPYCVRLFGSYENLTRALKFSNYLLTRSLDKVVKPNVAFLHECGIDATGIASLCLAEPWLLGTKPEQVRAMAVRAEAVGVPRGSGMFRLALQAVAFRSDETIAVKVEQLKNAFRWSDAEVGTAVCKLPMLLTMSKDTMQSKSEFLISEVGLEPGYIARRPAMLGLSLKGRLRPRYYTVKFLKDNGLLDRERDYFNTFAASEKVFVEKFIYRHKDAAPHLAEDYVAACRGEGPTNFRFT